MTSHYPKTIAAMILAGAAMALTAHGQPAAAADPATTTAPEVKAPEPALAAGLSDYRHELARTLGKGDSPRDWALAAQLLETQPPSGARLRERLQLLRRAAAAAPGDRIVQSAWARVCENRRGCGDPGALARIDPGNGAAWIPPVTVAWKSGNLRAVDAGLARIAASGRFNEHYGQAIGVWRELFARHPPPSPAQADPAREADYVLSLALDEATAMAIPDTAAIIDACSKARHPQASSRRFASCGRVGRLLMDRAQTLTGRMAGVLLVRGSETVTRDDDARIRTIAWRFEQMGKVYAQLAADPVARQNYVNMVQANDSEMAAIGYQLAISGLPPLPPAGWEPAETTQPVRPQAEAATP